jgi:hypothetical protein
MSEESQTKYPEVEIPEGLLKEIETVSKEKRLNKEERSKLEEIVRKMYLGRMF